MRIQATRYTRKQLAYLAHWEAKGYTFAPGEMPPMNTLTPPSLATRRPILDAFAGGCIAVVAVLMGCTWLAAGAGLMG